MVEGLNLAAVVTQRDRKGEDSDPWFLVTNLRKAETPIKRYEEGFHIEEWFKDFKHQLGIARLQTRNLIRVRRLVLVSAVAYGLCMVVGNTAARLQTIQDKVITGGKKSASRIWFSLKIIKHRLCGSIFCEKVYAIATVP